MIGILCSLGVQMAATARRPVWVTQNWTLLWFWFALVMSHLANTYLWGSQQAFIEFGKIAILYFVILNTVTSERKLRWMFVVLVLLTVLLAWQGIDQYYDWRGKGWAWQEMARGDRISWVGEFADPNDLAIVFIVIVPILLGYIFRGGNVFVKLIPIALLVPVVYALYLTNSRGGFFGLMAAIYYFFLRRSRHFVAGAVFGAIFASVAYLFGPSRLGMLSAEDASAYGRLDAWYYGFQLLKSAPIFGIGFNLFTNDYPLTAHNSFVLAAAELGLFGLYCWVALLYVAAKGLWQVRRYAPSLASHAIGLEAGLVGYLAASFFLSRTYISVLYVLCGMAAALYALARKENPEAAFRLRLKDFGIIGVLSALSLVMVQFAMKTWL